jgi:ATP-binding cassette subfamily G (WHITE) protein 2
MFYDLKKTYDPGVQNRLGAIFFIVISQIFSNVTALEPFLKERVLFIHVSVSYVIEIYTLSLISSRSMQVVITEFSHILLPD